MGRQILLIDDSAMLRRMAAGVLQAQPAHYQVIAATRASEGFARACGGEAVVILVDERLAGGVDAEFCHRLLNEPRTARVPVVLLTGRNGDAPGLGTLPGNVVEVLSKPFPPEQLASLVNTITALSRQGTGLDDMRRTFHPDAAGEPASSAPTPPRIEDPAQHPADTPRREREPSIRAALRAAAAAGGTSVLRLCPTGETPTEVYFDDGRLIVVSTRDGTAYSRDAAEVLPAKVSPATLQEAADEQSRTGVPFLLTLGARGLVSKAVAVEWLRRFGQQHFAPLWTFPVRSLHIDFERLEALPGFALRLEPMREALDEWLLGSLRLLTGADLAPTARHQGLVGTPSLTPRGETLLKPLPLNAQEREFIRRVNGRHDLPTIAKGLGILPEDAYPLLHRFRCLEALEYRSAPLPFVMTPRTNIRRVLPLKR